MDACAWVWGSMCAGNVGTHNSLLRARGARQASSMQATVLNHRSPQPPAPPPFTLFCLAVWAAHFYAGLYRKLYGRSVSSEAAARQLLARSCRGTIVGEAHALGLLAGVPGAGQAAAVGAALAAPQGKGAPSPPGVGGREELQQRGPTARA